MSEPRVITLDKSFLSEQAGRITSSKQREIDEGLRLVLAL
jgi:hypothetical protein